MRPYGPAALRLCVGAVFLAHGVQKLFDAISNFKYRETREWTTDDVAIVEWVGTGTHSGLFAGVAATEKPVGWTALSVIFFDDAGLIKEEHVYWDIDAVLSQIGHPRSKLRPVVALPTDARFEPNLANKPIYDEMYAAFRDAHRRNRPLFAKLNGRAA